MTVASAMALAIALTVLLLGAASAQAVDERTVTIKGSNAPGPSRYDQLQVTKIGPDSATRVLVLIPGSSGGRGDFTLIGRALVERIPDLQVWALDRRSQAFEDTSMFAAGLAGTATLQEVFDYYLGWLLDDSIDPHFTPLDASKAQFTKKWGLEVALEDTRKVVRQAARGGRQVVLGGHSLGASSALAYASWDFAGRPGYGDVEGLVLIDGGLLGTFTSLNLRQAKREIEQLEGGAPFNDLLGIGLPWAAGVFAEVGGLYAKLEPTARSPLQDSPLLPEAFKPDVSATNRALFGYAFDKDTSPKELALIQVRAGQLAASGDPRDWEDGEVTPVANLADLFAQEPANSVEWYFPRRLTIDVDGASSMRRDKVTRFLDLRTWHTAEIDVPVYAFQTDLTDGRVLRGARRLMERSEVPPEESVLVNRESSTSHLDPLTAAPDRNDFLNTVVPFLENTYR